MKECQIEGVDKRLKIEGVDNSILKSRKSDIEKSKVRYSILVFRLFNIELKLNEVVKAWRLKKGIHAFEQCASYK